MIDLHTHSSASDGSDSPSQLIENAKAAGLSAVALTDHDTIAGLSEARRAAGELQIEFIPGCELSVTHGQHRFHMVGLFLPEDASSLQRTLDMLIEERNARNGKIIEKLNQLNIDITIEEVIAKAGGDAVGRPHMAAVLFEKHVVNSMQQAFDQFLGSKGKAYLPKQVLTAAQALQLLTDCGATPIMAHPYSLNLGAVSLAEVVTELRSLGLDGIEAYYPEHTPSQTEQFLALAKRLDLAVSGGSDYHGSFRPHIQLGRGKGTLHVRDELLTALKERRIRRGLSA
ncbi:PHP domain-containing protein [Megalodesulfovibrio gigas]|uniref:PHP domain-containing protein n=1 Tax=Megalodesulfovibrio gigas TaxID=879 RepID=UPI000422A6C3|nr:PHP domain-containing protein [Megalodesulfovibrio gigas]